MKGPAPRPCQTCPYSQSTPPGVWDESEYNKLPGYDGETWGQHPSVFVCHEAPERACAGWCGTHDMDNNLALRLASLSGNITPETAQAMVDYESPVPLWSSGAAAARHGKSAITNPPPEAAVAIAKLTRKQRERL